MTSFMDLYHRYLTPAAEVGFATAFALAGAAGGCALFDWIVAPCDLAVGLLWVSSLYFAYGLASVAWRPEPPAIDPWPRAGTTHLKLPTYTACEIGRPVRWPHGARRKSRVAHRRRI